MQMNDPQASTSMSAGATRAYSHSHPNACAKHICIPHTCVPPPRRSPSTSTEHVPRSSPSAPVKARARTERVTVDAVDATMKRNS